jgi:murein biosynthesis integral membrane protein MurJ
MGDAVTQRALARGAATISVITLVSRLVGLARQLVFQATVGVTLLGTVYTTANYVPNITFELVAGGALAGMVVPLLAGAAARGDLEAARQTSAALTWWTLLVLVPATVLGMLLARPIAAALLGGAGGEPAVEMASRMLLVFLPQVPLYGLAVVSASVLNAQGRFAAAAVAPLVSSLVMIASFVLFAVRFDGDRNDLEQVPLTAELTLSVGTTLGVVALAATTLVPALRRGMSVSPTLSFPPGVAARARRLAVSGLSIVAAQQVAMLVVIPLANGQGGPGALVTYQYSWMIMMLPYAVLAYPIATAAFPRLSAQADSGEHDAFATTSAGSARAAAMAGLLGAGVLAAGGAAVARFFGLVGLRSGSTGGSEYVEMARTLVAIAPAVAGTGLVLLLGRVLLAQHRGMAAAVATSVGWASVIGIDVMLVAVVPTTWVVPALGLGLSVGLAVGSVLLAAAVRRAAGPAAVAGLGRTVMLGCVAAVAGAALGRVVADLLLQGEPGWLGTIAVGLCAGAVCLLVMIPIGLLADRASLLRLARRPGG